MISTGNLLSEVEGINPSKFSSCRVHYNGYIGEGTRLVYEGGGAPFEVWITPEQARVLSELQNRFSISGIATGDSNPSSFEKNMLRQLPDCLVKRYKDGRVEMSAQACIDLYDFS
jgi:hypothetical protein